MDECQVLEAFLNDIDSGELNMNTTESYRYVLLLLLARTTIKIPGGMSQYIRIKQYIEGLNIRRLRKQERIVIVFMAYDSSTWIGDELAELFERSERFDPYVLLTSVYSGQSDELRLSQYEENLRYFEQRNVKLLPSINPENGDQYTWADLGVFPDLCIWLSPYSIYRDDFSLFDMPLSVLHTYIPYGFNVASDKKHSFFGAHFNLESHLMMWKVFYESKATVRLAAKHCLIGDTTAVYTGYPKMDAFYRQYDPDTGVWSALLHKGENAGKKKIIYSPHHTIADWEVLHYSTFTMNYRFMLELAKKYSEETVWIFRPHPILKDKTIREGFFRDSKEWDDYVAEWDSLENAMSYERGDYAELMIDSDAMIMDCGSFIGEYVYAQRPMLFLDSGRAAFNEFGDEIMQVHYRANGDDLAAIEQFITDTVIGEKDTKSDIRREYFRDNMDYRTEFHGKSAAQNIFEYLNNQLSEQ